jgi:hypothetical protein
MTARWSGVEPPMDGRKRLSSRCSISKLNAGGVTHGARREVSRGGVDIECS